MSVAPDAEHGSKVQGQNYQEFIAHLHRTLSPNTYFEIGTLNGGTLKHSSCASIAVDPAFQLSSEVIGRKPSCQFFQTPSDTFFRKHDPRNLLGSEIDLAFLDGMHLFEFLLRDFINTEKYCRRNSIILLHDCLPPGFYMTSRLIEDPIREHSKYPGWWTGDVWKVVPILEKYRPDLSITVLDCAPTGLVMITNLDPNSCELAVRYGEIIGAHSSANIDRAEFDLFWENVSITAAGSLQRHDQLSTKFWL